IRNGFRGAGGSPAVEKEASRRTDGGRVEGRVGLSLLPLTIDYLCLRFLGGLDLRLVFSISRSCSTCSGDKPGSNSSGDTLFMASSRSSGVRSLKFSLK